MACNCNNVIDLGCFNSCDNINTGINALESGTYKIYIDFLGAKMVDEQNLLIGNEIVINKVLNENHEYQMQVVSPSGVQTCYRFKTYIEIL